MSLGRELGDAANPGIRRLSINTQTGTSYTLTVSDNGKAIEFDNASPITVTIPLESSENLGDGFQCTLVAKGLGSVTVVGEGGVVINALGGILVISTQYASAVVKKTGTDEFLFKTGGTSAILSAMTLIEFYEFNTTTGSRAFVLPAEYDLFEIIIMEVEFVSNSSYPYIRVSNDGGSTFDNGNNYEYHTRCKNCSGITNTQNGVSTLGRMTDTGSDSDVGNQEGEHFQFGRILLSRGSNIRTGAIAESCYGDVDNDGIMCRTGWVNNALNGVDAILVAFSGSALKGKIFLYGYEQ